MNASTSSNFGRHSLSHPPEWRSPSQTHSAATNTTRDLPIEPQLPTIYDDHDSVLPIPISSSSLFQSTRIRTTRFPNTVSQPSACLSRNILAQPSSYLPTRSLTLGSLKTVRRKVCLTLLLCLLRESLLFLGCSIEFSSFPMWLFLSPDDGPSPPANTAPVTELSSLSPRPHISPGCEEVGSLVLSRRHSFLNFLVIFLLETGSSND